MRIEDSGGRRVKSVQLIRQGPSKLRSWFEENQYKMFQVLDQREGGFDVDLTPCGAIGEMGYLSDGEVRIVEYHEPECITAEQPDLSETDNIRFVFEGVVFIVDMVAESEDRLIRLPDGRILKVVNGWVESMPPTPRALEVVTCASAVVAS